MAEIEAKKEEDKQVFKMILNSFKESYDYTIEQSPEMFGFIKIKKFNLVEKFILKI